uniref:Bulb-type lectin domain-containing protein n=1 Tax=Monopterus albus TaxID=43700 RepID=A0A3Q3J4E3_MONAL
YYNKYAADISHGGLALPQHNENFVLYELKQKWASNTPQFNGNCIVLEDDGTLAIYQGGEQMWFTGQIQPQSPKMRLSVTDDGHLTITDAGKLIWTMVP